jgi:hypothetical protein
MTFLKRKPENNLTGMKGTYARRNVITKRVIQQVQYK